MSELRSSEPSRSSNFVSSRSDAAPKLTNLLASLDPKTRAAIEALSQADPAVRAEVLASLDTPTRTVVEMILDQMA
jgi:hypothetical protein